MKLDYAVRDQILGITPDTKYYGGTASFTGLSLLNLKRLIELGFADPEDAQNDAPTIGEIVHFMEENPGFTAHGYAVSVEREDVRVSLEGVESINPTPKQRVAFRTVFGKADEFVCDNNKCYAWFD